MDESNPDRRLEPLGRDVGQEFFHLRELLLANNSMAWRIDVLLLHVFRRIKAQDDRAEVIDAIVEREATDRITRPEIRIESLIMKVCPRRPALLICLFCKWPAPGSEDTELGVLMELEVGHGETKVYPRVQA